MIVFRDMLIIISTYLYFAIRPNFQNSAGYNDIFEIHCRRFAVPLSTLYLMTKSIIGRYLL